MRKNKRNAFFKIFLSILFWIFLLTLVVSFSPAGYLMPVFFLLLFLGLYFFLSAFLALASPITIGIVGYLALRFFHMDNNLNLILLGALILSLGLYQSKS